MNPIRAYAGRVRALGWPLLATGLAVFLGLVALSQPVWVYERTAPGGDVDRLTFGWSMVVDEQWENGAWSSTTWVPYSSPTFPDLQVRDAVQASYLTGVLALIALIVFAGLQFLSRNRQIPALVSLVTGAMALGFTALAILYPMVAIPPAAAVDVNPSITGYTGTAAGPGNQMYAWGAGATWWLWLAALLLTLVVFVVPLAQRRSWTRPAPAH